MLNTKMSTAAVNAEADALGLLLNSGFIDIYDGFQPDDADVPVEDQHLIVRLTFAPKAFGLARGGVLVANSITQGVAMVTSQATWFRTMQKNGTPLWDGSVGASGDDEPANLLLPTTIIVAKQTVTCSRFTHTIAKAKGLS